jgi:glucose/mannose transport system substrate-binding protein
MLTGGNPPDIFMNSDPGVYRSPNRKWDDTTNLVITGKALLQIHGDWMKGEFRAAGKQPGVDFDCMNIPGTKESL